MGRYSHVAVAIDPVSDYMYETKDAGASLLSILGVTRKSGFYRLVPNVAGRLAAGGQLFMLRIKARSRLDRAARLRTSCGLKGARGALQRSLGWKAAGAATTESVDR